MAARRRFAGFAPVERTAAISIESQFKSSVMPRNDPAMDRAGHTDGPAGLHSPQRCVCSPEQRRFWVLDQLNPHDPALNVAVRWKLLGRVPHDDLEAAFRLILKRQELLRTRFFNCDGEPMQVIAATLGFRIPVVDLTALPEAEARAEAERIARLEAVAPFDLTVPPLIRVTHLRVRPEESMLLVTAHHIISDGWSIGILAREMGTICAALHHGTVPELPPLPLSYTAYARKAMARLNSSELREQTEYWTRSLQGARHFELQPDHPRPPVQTSNGNILGLMLERSLTDGLVELSRREGCTLFMTALAAFLTLLHRYTGETDIAIGTQIAGRDEVELEGLVGPFINTLLLRNDLSGDPAFLALLERVSQRVMDAYENQHVPLERLVEILKPRRDPSRNALFSVNFIFQRSFVRNDDYGSFRLVDLPSSPAGAMYDLNVFMVERPEGWRASCEYNTDLFEGQTIQRLLGHFHNLLQAVVESPERPISSLPLLSPDERRALLLECNRTDAAYPADQSVPTLFQAQADRGPDAAALICAGHRLSYRELDEASNRLARHLQRCHAAPGQRVAVCLQRTPELLVALLAVLKSGGAYIPLDPAYPPERIAQVLESAQPAAIVTRSSLRERLPADAAGLVLVDADAHRIEAQPAGRLERMPAPEDVAYVIFTSGSTGKPKGVQIQHQALTNLLWAMRDRPGLDADDTLLSVTTISFDIAGLELFLPLICGARIVLAQEQEVLDGRRLQQLMQQESVTVLQATPATWQLLIDSGWKHSPRLKMLCGGEALPRKLAQALLQRGAELWNVYGPTETTIWSSALKVEAGEGAVPIGPPIANTQFYVLDGQLQPMPLGVPGELYIGGDGVALGYCGLPELTRERFLPDPFRGLTRARMYRTGDIVRRRADGCFDYFGRSDHQVKLRGFRIELGEIESVLQRNPGVAEAVAILGRDAAGEPGLWSYVVPVAAADSGLLDGLRADLAKSLPAYMQPSAVVALQALPRTPNGKVDRKALPAPKPEQQGGAHAVPFNEIESRVAAIWCAVLGIERVDRDSHFIDLGGHSLQAARLLARIESEFGCNINLGALFQTPTIAGQAELIAKSEVRDFDFRQVVRLHANGSRPPLIAINNTTVHYYSLARRLGPEQPVTALQLFDPSLQRGRLPASFEEIAAGYVRLIRETQPSGPYRLMGWCIGGALAYEAARQLSAAGEQVDRVIVFDAWTPGFLQRLPYLQSRLADYSYRWQLILADWLSLAAKPGRFKEFLLRRVVVQKIRKLLGWKEPPPIAVDDEAGRQHDQWLLGFLQEAARRYRPWPYAGKLTLVRSSREPHGLFLDPTMGWGAVCKDVEVRIVEGDHFTMFQDPGVGQIAGHLSRIVERP